MVSPVSLTCAVLALVITVGPGEAIRCFDCNSGVGWNNTNCPANGDLAFDLLTTVECSELCFARTHIWNPGAIFRGCSTWFWLPRPLPTSDCITDDRGDDWCFCDGEECNTMPMIAK